MTPEDWKEIDESFKFLSSNRTAKIENDKWTMYKVGANVIRIDIKVKT